MQHKRRRSSRRWMLPLLLAAVLVVGLIVLMARDIPVPQQLVEKQLDAKAFLGTKPL